MRSLDSGLFCCAFLKSGYGFGGTPRVFLFRLFDILKPWPVSAAERLPGGIGVMADDLVAGTLPAVPYLWRSCLFIPLTPATSREAEYDHKC